MNKSVNHARNIVIGPKGQTKSLKSAGTIGRLRLAEGARVSLTNRFDFGNGGPYEVIYVKNLILEPNSVLDTAFNRLYYENLDADPNSVVKNKVLFGLSLSNIDCDKEPEFVARVTPNNSVHPEEPNLSRIHVQRVTGCEPDPNGMMLMRNLLDKDPNSPHYGQMVSARTKCLFAESSEDEILIMFKYLFETANTDVELVVYLSDVPELLDHSDPCSADHYIEVARLSVPPATRPGSAGSGRFGVFYKYVWCGDLNFAEGTRIELELINLEGAGSLSGGDVGLEPMGSGSAPVTIDDLDMQVHCSGICMDLSGDDWTDEEDFVIVVSGCGESATGLTPGGIERVCLDGLFSNDGHIDSYDVASWDWTVALEETGQLLSLCYDRQLPLIAAGGLPGFGGPEPLAELPSLNDLLIAGKRRAYDAPTKLKDRLYIFDNQYQCAEWFTTAPERCNIRLVQDFDGNLYQLNAETGVLRLDTGEVIIPDGELTGITEPRYEEPSTVYVGIQIQTQGQDVSLWGRPILDAAFDVNFDNNNYVYVVPVVVEPDGQEPYMAAAKLELDPNEIPPHPPYNIVQLYDDPNIFNQGLREIEMDSAGNLYVVNAHAIDESDILWRYDSNGTIERLDLGDSNSVNYVPDPIGMCVSKTEDMLYLASGQNLVDANSTTVYGFSTDGDLTLERTITIRDMGHITSITENPMTGSLWVAGFSMEHPPLDPNPYGVLPFYEPNLAEVPSDSNDVWAFPPTGVGDFDLAMPLSIVWTGETPKKCGGADLDESGDVNFGDFAILALQWLQAPGTPSADIAYEPDGIVDLLDLAVLIEHWLENGCTDP